MDAKPVEAAQTRRRSRWDLDTTGATASLACAIHCALMPIVVTALPLAGLGFLAGERTEWGLCAASAAFGLSSLCLGYREHRRRRALAILAAGMGALLAGRIIEERSLGPAGIVLVVAGGCAVALSHLINRALCLACRACHAARNGEENS